MSNSLQVKGLRRDFGSVVALDNFNLDVAQGEMVALLGPSGCGKTTALRIIAGLEKSDSGSVTLNSVDITHKAPHTRNMGMVFQAYSLFPHLTVAENVAFGLKMRKICKISRESKINAILELVGLNHHHKRFPHQLSGGQQQRVALARALVIEPEVLLLDEPLSALDAQVRTNLREEIRRLQLSLGTTTLFVTHDQEEAMAVSDRVGVMSNGKLEQIDIPDVLYNNPASAFVANFVGTMNHIPGTQSGENISLFDRAIRVKNSKDAQGTVSALVRPESIEVTRVTGAGHAKIITRSFLGASSLIICQTPDGSVIQALMPSHDSGDLHPGEEVNLHVTLNEVLVSNV